MQFVEMPPSSSVKYPRSLPISLVSFPGTPIRTRTFFRAHPTVTQTLLFFPLSLFTVVQQFYQTEVNNEYVIRGNAAVLKCSIPSFVADFVNVVSWHDTEGHNYAMEQTNYDSKYLVLPSGELHIRDVGPEDGYKSYQCRTKHRLTGETRLSATKGRLVITGKWFLMLKIFK
jgi:hypothetical protein